MAKKRILLYTAMLLFVILCVFILGGCEPQGPFALTIEQADHATVTTDKTSYMKGETVVVNMDVEEGYICSLTVGNESHYGNFEMPGYSVVAEVVTRPRKYRINYENTEELTYNGIVISEYTVEQSISLPIAYKTGYIFDGWYTEPNFQNKIKDIPFGTTGDITLYPKFKLATYEIRYHLPEGVTNNPDNPTSYTMTSDALPLYPVEKEGCEFGGWYWSDRFIGDGITEIPTGHVNVIDLYPKFLSVDYDENGFRIIRTKYDLIYILDSDRYEKDGKYVLYADITFGDDETHPSLYAFEGVFDGGGHTIENLNRAFFDTVKGATIQNLTFSTSQNHKLAVSSTVEHKIGGLVNEVLSEGTTYIKNVHVKSAKMRVDMKAPAFIGALVGRSYWGKHLVIEECLVENLDFDIFTAGSLSVGGILGCGSATMSECAVRMDEDDLYDVECTKSYSEFFVGGLVGIASDLTMSNCYFRQEDYETTGFKVYASKYCIFVGVGGLMGYASSVSVSDSYALLTEINFDSNAVGATPVEIFLAGLIGFSESATLTQSYVDSNYGDKLMINSTIMKSGITMRFHMGYVSGHYRDETTYVTYDKTRCMTPHIYSNNEKVNNSQIDDEAIAHESTGAPYYTLWSSEYWTFDNGKAPELKSLTK